MTVPESFVMYTQEKMFYFLRYFQITHNISTPPAILKSKKIKPIDFSIFVTSSIRAYLPDK